MNTAFLTWTIVLGGWILPEVGSPAAASAPGGAAIAPRAGVSDSRGGAAPAPVRGPQNDPAGRAVSPYGQAQSPYSQAQSPYSQAQSPYMSPSQASRHRIPAIPTAPDAGQQGMMQPTMPHAGPAEAMQYGSRATVPQMPYSSTGAPGTPGYRQPSTVQPARIGTGIVGSPGIASDIVKPFSNYQPLPVISPYLNLDRRDGLDYDNYNTLVRPFVEQDYRNSQLQNEVQVLQNTLNQQQRALQQMNRQTEIYQGQTQSRHFQDTGGYFPSP